MNQRIKREVREWTESIIIAVIIALVIRTFVVQAFKIPSGSMIPTFQIGDRIFVSKFIYGARFPLTDKRLPAVRQPKRGDIVVFISPELPKKDFIKRLVALGGEKVELRDGTAYINGKPVDDAPSVRSNYYFNHGDYGAEGKAIDVPKDSYYVLGDNSNNSRDSRYWGYVPKKNLIGKALCIYWPLNRIRLIK